MKAFVLLVALGSSLWLHATDHFKSVKAELTRGNYEIRYWGDCEVSISIHPHLGSIELTSSQGSMEEVFDVIKQEAAYTFMTNAFGEKILYFKEDQRLFRWNADHVLGYGMPCKKMERMIRFIYMLEASNLSDPMIVKIITEKFK